MVFVMNNKLNESEQLILRPLQAERDIERIFATIEKNRSYLSYYLPWAQQVTKQEELKVLQQLEAKAQEGLPTYLLEVEGQMLGMIGVNRLYNTCYTAEIGYWLAKEASHQGWMTKALQQMEAKLFAEGVHRLELVIAEDNQASRAVAERCHFQLEGIAKDALFLEDGFHSVASYAKIIS